MLDLRSSEVLYKVVWYLFTDISEQCLCHILKGQQLEPERSDR